MNSSFLRDHFSVSPDLRQRDARGEIDPSKTLLVRARVPIPLGGGLGDATFISFSGESLDQEHFVIRLGQPDATRPLVRIHSECMTGDLFGSLRCDCGQQLDSALALLADRGGYLIYLRQEGRGIGLYAKLDAYGLQDAGYDTFEANIKLNFPEDMRDFSIAAKMLSALGLGSVCLITNNPNKIKALQDAGISVEKIISAGTHITAHNIKYLKAKLLKHKHNLAM